MQTQNENASSPVEAVVICACGSKLFYKSVRTGGWWKTLINENGETLDTDLDAVKYGAEPKTVKCAECGKTNRNPSYR